MTFWTSAGQTPSADHMLGPRATYQLLNGPSFQNDELTLNFSFISQCKERPQSLKIFLILQYNIRCPHPCSGLHFQKLYFTCHFYHKENFMFVWFASKWTSKYFMCFESTGTIRLTCILCHSENYRNTLSLCVLIIDWSVIVLYCYVYLLWFKTMTW